MYFVRIVFVATMLFSCFCAFGQKKERNEIKLKLTKVSDFKKIRATILTLDPVKIWGSETTVDSILWNIPLKKNTHDLSEGSDSPSISTSGEEKGRPCTDLPGGLSVLQENLGDSTRISLTKRYNSFLKKDIQLVYPTDSLMNWTFEDVPEGVIPQTSVNFPFCINNQRVDEQVDLYLIPLKDPVITWNDDYDRLNHIPTLSMKLATNKTAHFSGAEIYAIQLKYRQGPPLSIEIKENGEFYRDKVVQGIQYKHSYQLHDTVYIGGKPYRLDSVDRGVKNLYLHPVMEKKWAHYIPEDYMTKLLPYFSENKDDLVLDFWGTWCAPCIAALPHLQELYKSSKEKYNFLSICFDQPQNFDKAKAIFSEHGATWPQLLDRQPTGRPQSSGNQQIIHSMSMGLKVYHFPTYMVINKKGKILYRNFGTEGFEGLKKFILKH